MTVSLMVMALWTSALLAAGAWAVDRLLRPVRVQTRLVWASAMAMSVGLVGTAPLRLWWTARDTPAQLLPDFVIGGSRVPQLADVAALAAPRLPAWTGTMLLWLWVASSVATLLVLVASYRRHRRLVRTAGVAVLAGSEVRVTETIGPAVIGVRRPAIIVPRWLLARSEQEQRLVIAHEREHIVTNDPTLLLIAAAMVVLMPWNPALWWSFSRLRLATELDCDARVLLAGAPPLAYGNLLLDLTDLLAPTRAGVPAFGARPSQLEQRLLAMTTRTVSSRRRLTMMVAAAVLASGTGLAACSAKVKAPSVASEPQPPVAVNSGLPYFDFQVEKVVEWIAGSGAPVYPAELRSALIEGEVLAQFVVDTTGRIETESYKVVRQSHDLFGASVRTALPEMRFTPAEVGGRKVRQLVQQPFVFQMAR